MTGAIVANDIFGALTAKVDNMGTTAVETLYTSLGSSLQPVFWLALTIYVAFWGYQIIMGRSQVSPTEAAWRIGRVMLIYTMAFSWGEFSLLVVETFTSVANGIGTAVCSAVGGTNCGDAQGGATQGLSDIWIAANEVSAAVSKAGGTFGVGLMILSWIILIVAGLFVAFALFLIVYGKMALFVLLALAPIFICMALFQVSSAYFDGWLRACVQFALIPIVVFAFLSFFLVLIDTTVTDMQAAAETGEVGMTIIGSFLLMCFTGFFLLSQVTSITALLTGGMGLRQDGLVRTVGRVAAFASGAGAAAAAMAIGRATAPQTPPTMSRGQSSGEAQIRAALDDTRR